MVEMDYLIDNAGNSRMMVVLVYFLLMVMVEAMARGLGSRLQQPMFTTCGKIKVKVPKYNNPRDLYGDSVMEEMISGSSVDPSKLDPDSEAYKKRAAMKSFDPKRSSVLLVLKEQEMRGFERSSVQ